MLSTQANPFVTIDTPGKYILQLTVSDDHGAKSRTTLPLNVGKASPQVQLASPQDGDCFTAGQSLAYQARVVDLADGESLDQVQMMVQWVYQLQHGALGGSSGGSAHRRLEPVGGADRAPPLPFAPR